MSLRMRLGAITLDCPDPLALAAFYEQVTGLEPHPKSNAEFAGLNREDGLLVGFQRVDDYRRPTWPGSDVPQQLHICFNVTDDLTEVETQLLGLGAAKAEYQPHDEDRARVFLDPAGHPFCVTRH
ncbi:VOC family protein [Streptomyces sp. TRM66268-LWL]|uniref:VOC family protein n=1 Tax=Streptomyces polyasparticus TaxID=2767826 RepID=A0ABR7SC46_9ACTN|nr:VOC family protein [Streptomyces polyasparticus]MBC9711908.1 VOC family protein [Streptomyces polyasparticus]